MDFRSLKRKQLQALCKKHGVPANLTNLEMAGRLASILKEDEEPVPEQECSVKNSGGIDTQNCFIAEVQGKEKKKVKFSPENQIFEYTRSVIKRTRKRRSIESKLVTGNVTARSTRSHTLLSEDASNGETQVVVVEKELVPVEEESKIGLRRCSSRRKAIVAQKGRDEEDALLAGRETRKCLRKSNSDKSATRSGKNVERGRETEKGKTKVTVVEKPEQLAPVKEAPTRRGSSRRKSFIDPKRRDEEDAILSKRETRTSFRKSDAEKSAIHSGTDAEVRRDTEKGKTQVVVVEEPEELSPVEEASRGFRRCSSRRKSVLAQKTRDGEDALPKLETGKSSRKSASDKSATHSGTNVELRRDTDRGQINSLPNGYYIKTRRQTMILENAETADEPVEKKINSQLGEELPRRSTRTSKVPAKAVDKDVHNTIEMRNEEERARLSVRISAPEELPTESALLVVSEAAGNKKEKGLEPKEAPSGRMYLESGTMDDLLVEFNKTPLQKEQKESGLENVHLTTSELIIQVAIPEGHGNEVSEGRCSKESFDIPMQYAVNNIYGAADEEAFGKGEYLDLLNLKKRLETEELSIKDMDLGLDNTTKYNSVGCNKSPLQKRQKQAGLEDENVTSELVTQVATAEDSWDELSEKKGSKETSDFPSQDAPCNLHDASNEGKAHYSTKATETQEVPPYSHFFMIGTVQEMNREKSSVVDNASVASPSRMPPECLCKHSDLLNLEKGLATREMSTRDLDLESDTMDLVVGCKKTAHQKVQKPLEDANVTPSELLMQVAVAEGQQGELIDSRGLKESCNILSKNAVYLYGTSGGETAGKGPVLVDKKMPSFEFEPTTKHCNNKDGESAYYDLLDLEKGHESIKASNEDMDTGSDNMVNHLVGYNKTPLQKNHQVAVFKDASVTTSGLFQAVFTGDDQSELHGASGHPMKNGNMDKYSVHSEMNDEGNNEISCENGGNKAVELHGNTDSVIFTGTVRNMMFGLENGSEFEKEEETLKENLTTDHLDSTRLIENAWIAEVDKRSSEKQVGKQENCPGKSFEDRLVYDDNGASKKEIDIVVISQKCVASDKSVYLDNHKEQFLARADRSALVSPLNPKNEIANEEQRFGEMETHFIVKHTTFDTKTGGQEDVNGMVQMTQADWRKLSNGSQDEENRSAEIKSFASEFCRPTKSDFHSSTFQMLVVTSSFDEHSILLDTENELEEAKDPSAEETGSNSSFQKCLKRGGLEDEQKVGLKDANVTSKLFIPESVAKDSQNECCATSVNGYQHSVHSDSNGAYRKQISSSREGQHSDRLEQEKGFETKGSSTEDTNFSSDKIDNDLLGVSKSLLQNDQQQMELEDQKLVELKDVTVITLEPFIPEANMENYHNELGETSGDRCKSSLCNGNNDANKNEISCKDGGNKAAGLHIESAIFTTPERNIMLGLEEAYRFEELGGVLKENLVIECLDDVMESKENAISDEEVVAVHNSKELQSPSNLDENAGVTILVTPVELCAMGQDQETQNETIQSEHSDRWEREKGFETKESSTEDTNFSSDKIENDLLGVKKSLLQNDQQQMESEEDQKLVELNDITVITLEPFIPETNMENYHNELGETFGDRCRSSLCNGNNDANKNEISCKDGGNKAAGLHIESAIFTTPERNIMLGLEEAHRFEELGGVLKENLVIECLDDAMESKENAISDEEVVAVHNSKELQSPSNLDENAGVTILVTPVELCAMGQDQEAQNETIQSQLKFHEGNFGDLDYQADKVFAAADRSLLVCPLIPKINIVYEEQNFLRREMSSNIKPMSSVTESNGDKEDSDRMVKSFKSGQWRYLRGGKGGEKSSEEINSLAVEFFSPAIFDSGCSTFPPLTVIPSLEIKELSTDAGEDITAGKDRGDECSSVDLPFPEHELPAASSHAFTKDQSNVAQAGNEAVALDNVDPLALKCHIEHEKTDRSQTPDVHQLHEATVAEQSDEHEVVKVMRPSSGFCSPNRKLVSHCDSNAPKHERTPVSLKIHDMKENAACTNMVSGTPIGYKTLGMKENVASTKVENIGNTTVPRNLQRRALQELWKN